MDKINFRALEDDNEHFLGIDLDEEKMNRLNAMRDACRKIVDLNPRIKSPFYPFDTTCRNAFVSLVFPEIEFMNDKTVTSLIGALFSAADDVVLRSREDGTILMSFGLHDMWDKFGYDNDMEHGK